VSDFPPTFTWGVSTSAFQIEGAATAGGRGESIWDRFTRRKGVIADGSDASIATDHYHRLGEDLDLVAALGVGAYRFSVSWSRLAPAGRGQYLADGWAFYDRVIDGLLSRGLEPWLCLYHWDLPQALQERGGWANRDIPFYFADHVERVVERVTDRVGHVLLLNEPNVHAVLGHLLGLHAPGSADLATFLAALHHQNLATGLAARRVRDKTGSAMLGTILNLQPVTAAHEGEDHEAAARLVDAAYNRACLDPLLKGAYPEPLADLLEPFVQEGDLGVMAVPLDFLGVNHYTRLHVRSDPEGPAGLALSAPPSGTALTAMGWEVAPSALRQQLLRLKDDYGNPPVYVTENGAAFADAVRSDRTGRIEDRDRASYLVAYLRELASAIEAGCDVRGYFVWTLVDNFEWSSGYRHRFGLVELDRQTLARRPKLSFDVFREIVATGSLPD
jgi:beta-glucosidase